DQTGEPAPDQPKSGEPAPDSTLPLGEAGRRPAGASSSEGEPSDAQNQGGKPGSQAPTPEQLQLLENIAARKQAFLDQLPPDVAGSIKELNDYEFMDPEAREKFQELLQMLQQQLAQSYFQGMQQGMQSLTPQDLAGTREMLKDLNQMLRDRAEGNEPDFEGFMQTWGQNFPDGIENLDQLIEHLADRVAQMQSLLQSMSPEQRRQLQEMAE